LDVTSLLSVLRTAEKLKDTTRHCYTSGGRHESVAEHSWRLCLFAWFLRDEFPELDMDKVLHMCLLHDMGEAFTGDIPTFWKDGVHESEESRLLQNWVDTLPQPYRQELTELYGEMDALEPARPSSTRHWTSWRLWISTISPIFPPGSLWNMS